MRALAQSGLYPSNCRLLDPGEAALTGAAPDGPGAAGARLRVGRPPARRRGSSAALELCARPRRRGARRARRRASAASPRAPGATPSCRRPTCATRWWPAGSWPRPSRPRSPGTASTRSWPRCASARRARAAARARVTCRLTHAYPDGAAPYFTVLAPARRGSELEQWARGQGGRVGGDRSAAGGTITHHHAVGPRPPALVRPPAPGAVRRGAARRQGRGRPGRDPQSRRAGRSQRCAEHRLGHQLRPHAVAACGHRPASSRRRRGGGAGAGARALVEVGRAELGRGGHGSLG